MEAETLATTCSTNLTDAGVLANPAFTRDRISSALLLADLPKGLLDMLKRPH